MENWIERYIFDVTRRLPEKDREEVTKELKANIYDMLPDNAGEDEIKEVICSLGSPVSLAEKYRQKPRYLISPAYYDNYISVLKIVLPLVGVLMIGIGFAIGLVDYFRNSVVDQARLVSSILSNGISMGVESVLQALVWVTVGFVIAERTGGTEDAKKQWRMKICLRIVIYQMTR